MSPGRLTVHSEVELGVQVRPGRRCPRALAQQQRGRSLVQAAPARVLHKPALDHSRSRRDRVRQAWVRGAAQEAGDPRSLGTCRGARRGHLPFAPSPLGFQGKEARGSLTQSHSEE